MKEALAPVMDWYQSDEEPPRPLADIARDAIDDLLEDRQDALRCRRAVELLKVIGSYGEPEWDKEVFRDGFKKVSSGDLVDVRSFLYELGIDPDEEEEEGE